MSCGWVFNDNMEVDAAKEAKINGLANLKYKYVGSGAQGTLMYVYPKLVSNSGLSIDKDSNCLIINPKEEILIPIVVEFCSAESSQIQKTLSFDIWPSLYRDPINYTFTITAKYESSMDEQIMQTQQELMTSNSKYNIIYK